MFSEGACLVVSGNLFHRLVPSETKEDFVDSSLVRGGRGLSWVRRF